MGVVFHCELSLALSHGSQPGAVAKHLCQWHMGFYNDLISFCFTILYESLSPVYIANDGALELSRCADLQAKAWHMLAVN